MTTAPLAPLPRLVRAQRAKAGDWLERLPGLAAEAISRWELTTERVAAPGGRDSMTVLVRRADGSPAALKLCAPGHSSERECQALEQWNGRGAVRVLEHEPQSGALLLERLRGETSLRSLPEAKAMLEAVSAAHRLWLDPGPGHPFPTVEERTAEQAERMLGTAPREVRPLVEEALTLRAELVCDGRAERFLLHGDFRQGAVLASDSERAPWLAAGPEPLVGERAYDLARLVRDRLHDLVASPGAAAVTRRRLTKLADAVDLDSERLRAWALFRAVESGVRHLDAGAREDGETLLEFATWL